MKFTLNTKELQDRFMTIGKIVKAKASNAIIVVIETTLDGVYFMVDDLTLHIKSKIDFIKTDSTLGTAFIMGDKLVKVIHSFTSEEVSFSLEKKMVITSNRTKYRIPLADNITIEDKSQTDSYDLTIPGKVFREGLKKCSAAINHDKYGMDMRSCINIKVVKDTLIMQGTNMYKVCRFETKDFKYTGDDFDIVMRQLDLLLVVPNANAKEISMKINYKSSINFSIDDKNFLLIPQISSRYYKTEMVLNVLKNESSFKTNKADFVEAVRKSILFAERDFARIKLTFDKVMTISSENNDQIITTEVDIKDLKGTMGDILINAIYLISILNECDDEILIYKGGTNKSISFIAKNVYFCIMPLVNQQVGG